MLSSPSGSVIVVRPAQFSKALPSIFIILFGSSTVVRASQPRNVPPGISVNSISELKLKSCRLLHIQNVLLPIVSKLAGR